MDRTTASSTQASPPTASETVHRKPSTLARPGEDRVGSVWDMLIIRGTFALVCVAAGYHFHPFGLSPWLAAAIGFIFSVAVLLFELRLQRASLRRLIGAAVGFDSRNFRCVPDGVWSLRVPRLPEGSRSFLDVAIFSGDDVHRTGPRSEQRRHAQPAGAGRPVRQRASSRSAAFKVLRYQRDHRRAGCRYLRGHFLDGTLLIPQFVLRELQLVADSADPPEAAARPARAGSAAANPEDAAPRSARSPRTIFAHVAEVDMKLIELAKRYDAKIITNDYNLNKVATLQGIDVLNVNQLANALKPVVLPGETMRVFILREGKEYNQGVAYLDDGTMVVVDGGAQNDQQDHRHFRHLGPPDDRREDDFRPVRRPRRSRIATGAAPSRMLRTSATVPRPSPHKPPKGPCARFPPIPAGLEVFRPKPA